ncbi:hypothetical protein P280DRAFT_519008 [Massarina eburnea CBS 473.64]|uniref:Rhodopsin domain-containing protein n=1 Tax=Massarina eburnea CBS 473.64 TaxID=1395130 RepID=A0A6A6RXV9_9PLEO|nr:hypothetical protein P280DRAFT_519008 [Massarina eburnea CBS 473.64]
MPESQGPTVISIAIVFAAITAVVLVSRIFARVCIVKRVGFDDIFIVIACGLSWAFCVVTVLAVNDGLGAHIENVTSRGIENMVRYSFNVWLSSIFYNACLGFIKISVLSLYLRLGDPWLRRLSFVMLGVVCCQAGGNVLACIFQCRPIKAAYDLRVTDEQKKCININAFYLANAAVNIFTDILTYTMPIHLVMNLQVPRGQKVGLGVILSLGLLACVSSVIRITYVPSMLVAQDATWVISSPMYWSVIEINIGILAASIPSFKAISKKYFPRLLGSSNGAKGNKNSSGKLSGFQKMDNTTDNSKGRSIALRTLERPGKKGMGIETHAERASEDDSSGDVPFARKGQIGVRTDIETHYGRE